MVGTDRDRYEGHDVMYMLRKTHPQLFKGVAHG